MLNPNPVSRKQMQNLDQVFIQMSLFINFIRTNFLKMSLCCFIYFLFWNCGLRIAKTNCLKFPLRLARRRPPSWIQWIRLWGWFNSWFHESGFGFRKSGLNKRNGLSNQFQFWSNQTGPEIPWCPSYLTEKITIETIFINCLFLKKIVMNILDFQHKYSQISYLVIFTNKCS